LPSDLTLSQLRPFRDHTSSITRAIALLETQGDQIDADCGRLFRYISSDTVDLDRALGHIANIQKQLVSLELTYVGFERRGMVRASDRLTQLVARHRDRSPGRRNGLALLARSLRDQHLRMQ